LSSNPNEEDAAFANLSSSESEEDQEYDSTEGSSEHTADPGCEEQMMYTTDSMEPGDYRVQVHVIEVRDLVPADTTGLRKGVCNPMVCAELFGQHRFTTAKPGATSATFEQTLTLSFSGLSRDDLEAGVISLRVVDKSIGPAFGLVGVSGSGSGRIRRSNSIGTFQIDLSRVYCSPGGSHELYRQWAALYSEHKVEARVRGFIKFTITVLGPRDSIPVHDVEADIRKEQQLADASSSSSRTAGGGSISIGSLLVPMEVNRKLNYLVLSVHQAEDLPPSCKNVYIEVHFAGVDARTRFLSKKHKHKQTAHFNNNNINSNSNSNSINNISVSLSQELWLPVFTPSMSNIVRVVVRNHHRNKLVRDEVLASFLFNYQVLVRESTPHKHTLLRFSVKHTHRHALLPFSV
jgi:hypothetical protein